MNVVGPLTDGGPMVPATRSRGLAVVPVAGPEGSCVITCQWCGARGSVDGSRPIVAQIRQIAQRHELCGP